MNTTLLVIIIILFLANIVISSMTLMKSKKQENFLESVYTGYTDQDSTNNCVLSQGKKCDPRTCQEGDPQCYCMVNCSIPNTPSRFLFSGDCSSGSNFDASRLCSPLGGNPSPF